MQITTRNGEPRRQPPRGSGVERRGGATRWASRSPNARARLCASAVGGRAALREPCGETAVGEARCES